jgi:hypothetical protein
VTDKKQQMAQPIESDTDGMMVTQQATNGTESIEPDTDGDGV